MEAEDGLDIKVHRICINRLTLLNYHKTPFVVGMPGGGEGRKECFLSVQIINGFFVA